MIFDQLGMFFDGATLAATGTGAAIRVMPRIGRSEVANIVVCVAGTSTANTLTIKVQESADNSAFTDVATYTLTKATAKAAIAVIPIPRETKAEFIRLTYAATGTVTGSTVTAGITRGDVVPYEKGLWVDGKAVG